MENNQVTNNARGLGMPLSEPRREEMLRIYSPENITLARNDLERTAARELTELDVSEKLYKPYNQSVERTRCREQFLIQLGSLVSRQDFFAKYLTTEDKKELRKITEALLDVIDGGVEVKKRSR